MPFVATGSRPGPGSSARSATMPRRGYVLVFVSLMMVVLIGVVGLAIDIGHMYATRAEAQSFCDAAALAAAKTLDPTVARFNEARAAAMATQKNWDMGARPFTTTGGAAADGVTIQVAFGPGPDGPFVAAPADPATNRFAEVRATVGIGIWLLTVITGEPAATIAARAVAGAQDIDEFERGLGPFAPISGKKAREWCAAQVPPLSTAGCAYNDVPPIGLIPGHEYTLRWTSGLRPWADLSETDKLALCEGDRCECAVAIARASGMDTRGFALYQSASNIKETIFGDPPPLDPPLEVDGPFIMSSGNMQAEMRYLNDRVDMDDDDTSWPYSVYSSGRRGSGLRIMPVPIAKWEGALDGNKTDFRAAGFAGFFLRPVGTYGTANVQGGGTPPSKECACGEYFGEYTYGSAGSGGPSGPELKRLRLFR